MSGRGRLNSAAVIAAAGELADDGGLDNLTLAGLAAKLGIRSASLFNHVAGLADLKRGLALLGLREMTTRLSRATIGKTGDDAIMAFATAYRDYAKARPGVYATTVTPPAADDAAYAVASELLEVIGAVMGSYRLSGAAAIHAIRGLRSVVHGFVVIEQVGGFGIPLDVDESFRRLVQAFATSLPGFADAKLAPVGLLGREMADLLYGRNAVREALQDGRRRAIRLLIADGVKAEGSDTLTEAIALAKKAGVQVENTPRDRLDQMTAGANHQGVALEASPYPYADFDDLLASLDATTNPLLLALDHLQDPQNVGTLLRAAEAVGVAAVLLPNRRAASITPAVSNSSAGAVEHLQIAEITNLPRAIEQLQAKGVWVAGLDEEGKQLFEQADLTGPLLVVVGSEGSGLQRLTREHCDFLLRLPMRGKVASLNAAVAGSIALYEALRQRG